MENNKRSAYTTTNTYLAACMMVGGASLVDVDRSDPIHVRFILSGERLEEIERRWDNRILSVNAREFADNLRELKHKLYKE